MIKRVLMLSILLTGTLVAQEAKVTPLLSKDLTGIPGKEALMITVDVRVVGRNASKSKSAKFLVVFVKNKGAPLLLTAK